MNRIWSAFWLLTVLALASGCGASRTMVLDLPEEKVVADSIEIVRGESTVQVPEEVVTRFEEELRKNLYEGKEGEEAPFAEGSGLKLEYCFIQYDKGNQFARYMWGGIGNAGEGTMTVLVRYLDSGDQEVARIQSEGKIGSGFFGGSMKSAINRCAEEVSNYTTANFH